MIGTANLSQEDLEEAVLDYLNKKGLRPVMAFKVAFKAEEDDRTKVVRVSASATISLENEKK